MADGFRDLTGARHPDLAPGSADTARALTLLDRLTNTVAPALLPDAPAFVDALESELGGWQHLADTSADLDPWSASNLDRLAATERFWRHYGDGTTLLHPDLGADTILLADAEDVVTDWAYPHQGAAWLAPALFLPHLVLAGYTPQQAEALMETSVAAWGSAPCEAITLLRHRAHRLLGAHLPAPHPATSPIPAPLPDADGRRRPSLDPAPHRMDLTGSPACSRPGPKRIDTS